MNNKPFCYASRFASCIWCAPRKPSSSVVYGRWWSTTPRKTAKARIRARMPNPCEKSCDERCIPCSAMPTGLKSTASCADIVHPRTLF
eukprot:scaffold1753_cov153-Amphora_coffeaeformis.AAC.7